MTREERIIQLQRSFIDGQKYDIEFNKFLWRGKQRNCLAYALNLININGDIERDGFFGIKTIEKKAYSSTEIYLMYLELFMLMNIHYKICTYKMPVPEGYYKIAMYITTKDVHWMRQDNNGTWSHKLGWRCKPQNKDRQGKPILSPENADIAISGEILEINYFLILHKNS